MRLFKRKDIPEAELDLTAMIDIVLLLIIFFTLTSQFTQSLQRPMPLPAERGELRQNEPAKSIVVDLDRAGTLSHLGGQPITPEEIGREIRTALAGRTRTEIDLVIRADRDMPSIHLNRLASTLARNGVRTWKLATSGDGDPAVAGLPPDTQGATP